MTGWKPIRICTASDRCKWRPVAGARCEQYVVDDVAPYQSCMLSVKWRVTVDPETDPRDLCTVHAAALARRLDAGGEPR